jgi:hypothetical protein
MRRIYVGSQTARQTGDDRPAQKSTEWAHRNCQNEGHKSGGQWEPAEVTFFRSRS